MPTPPAHSRFLLFIGILVNLLIFPLDHIVGWAVNHGDYTPFSVLPQVSAQTYDETHAYLPGPSRFLRTARIPMEVDLIEFQHAPSSAPIMHSVLVGLLAKGMGSLDGAWIVCRAVGPALIWAALFWIACGFTGSGPLAMAIAWAVCFSAFGPRNFLLLGKDRFIQPLELTRMPQPALAFLFLILAIWLLSRVLGRPGPIRIVLAGVLAGSLFYIYYFYWVSFFSGLGALLIALAIIRKWDFVKTVAAVFFLGCLTGIPFFVWTSEAMHDGHQRDLMMRVGTFTKAPNWFGAALALALFLALWLYCRIRIQAQPDEQSLFAAVLLAIAVGAAIGINVHLATGFDAQHDHFYNRALQPLLMYLFLLMVLRNVRRPPIIVTAAVIGVLVALAAVRQIQVGRNTAAYHLGTNPDMEVLRWVRSHLPADSVVGSDDANLIGLIPGIAGTWTFVPMGARTIASGEEILTRYSLLCRLEGRNWQEVETALRRPPSEKAPARTLSYTLVVANQISPADVETVKTIWDNFDLQRDFRDRRLDYVIVRRSDAVPVSPATGRRFDTLYQNSVWRLARVSQN